MDERRVGYVEPHLTRSTLYTHYNRQPCKVEKPTFKVGDRVSRPIDVFKKYSPLKHGTIVACYSQRAGLDGATWVNKELYDVLWDGNGNPSPGYFWWGLRKESK